jgi:hypothetical protein
VGTVLALGIALSACASRNVKDGEPFAEIDVTPAVTCTDLGAFIRELHDGKAQRVKAKSMPVRVPSGVYSIGVSCSAPQKIAATSCGDAPAQASSADVPAYPLVLRPGRRYTFSCMRVKGETSVRLSEGGV